MTATRVIALALIVSLSGCAFAVKHPAATAGIVGGSLGFSTCEIGTDLDAHGPCTIVGAGAALLLGGAVFVAMLLGGEGNTVLIDPTEDQRPEPPSIDDVPPATPVEPTPTTSPDAPPVNPAPSVPPAAATP